MHARSYAAASQQPARASAGRRLGYLIMTFPKVSETFISNEIRELARHDIHPVIFSVYPPVDAFMHPADIPLAWETHYLEPQPARWQTRLRAQLHYLGRRPIAFARMWFDILREWSPLYVRLAWHGLPWLRQIEAQGIGHLHCHFALNNSAVAWMLHRLAGTPYSITAHAVGIYTQHKLKRRLYEAECVISVCDYNTRYMERHFPHVKRVVKVMCGVSPDDFRRTTPYRKTAPFPIAAVGRLAELKGYPYQIEAMRILRVRGVDAQVRIVGEGKLRPVLEAQIAAAGLGDRVHLLGAQPTHFVREELEAASLLIHTSVVPRDGNSDSMALSVKEAMAMELPVIATDCVANPEMVDERCGVLVPEADAPALADAIAHFAAMPEEQLRRMGEAGRRRVVEEFSLAGQTALLAQEFRRLGVVPVSAEVHGSSLLRSLEPAG